MPRETTTNTSIIGLQRLGSFSAPNTFWEVRFASTPQQDRQVRMGTLLHVRAISNSRFPVIEAYPLYGAGASPAAANIPTYVSTEVWAIWFRSGLTWFYERESL